MRGRAIKNEMIIRGVRMLTHKIIIPAYAKSPTFIQPCPLMGQHPDYN